VHWNPSVTGARDVGTEEEMLLKLIEDLALSASVEEVWKLLRDTARLTGLLPGVESVAPLAAEGTEAYNAKVSEKIGPFKIIMNMEVRVTEIAEPSLLKATLRGADTMGLNRVTGSMQIALSPAACGTQMRFEASIEVLGKLATLGAVPIRRRTTDLFTQFAKNIREQFAPETGAAPN
jgi:carbon monoxide dehydrogenase subunit G